MNTEHTKKVMAKIHRRLNWLLETEVTSFGHSEGVGESVLQQIELEEFIENELRVAYMAGHELGVSKGKLLHRWN